MDRREIVNQYIVGDCIEVLRTMPDESVHCVVTSPPYYALRDYGCPGQLGLESTPDEYILKMVEVFEEVRRVLRSDGTLWLNIGDSFAGYWGDKYAHRPFGENRTPDDSTPPNKPSLNFKECGLKPKDLMMIPARLALALQAAGWWIRQDIIWDKGNPMPESVDDRPTTSHEHVFLLTKSRRYFFDWYAIAEPASENTKPGRKDGKPVGRMADPMNGFNRRATFQKKYGRCSKRRRRSVWRINPKGYSEAHFATFPVELPRLCIQAGTSEWGCCPRCSAPWVRQIEKKGGTIGRGGWREDRGEDLQKGKRQMDGGAVKRGYDLDYEVKTVGWAPSCECGETATVPALVLDPFGGSGTTGRVAEDLGRDWILIDINPKYKPMADRRTAQAGMRLSG